MNSMSPHKTTILVVDDEPFNLDILVEYVDDLGYESRTALNGEEAWAILQEDADLFDVVLLDRMMPLMDGMELLIRIKADEALKHMPVIMQTAMADHDSVLEGLNAGAFYYLTKPYDYKHLVAIVNSAVNDSQNYRSMKLAIDRSTKVMECFDHGSFSFSSLDEGKDIVLLLAGALPNANKIVLGLSELVINAVEHGNLGISYDEKSQLNETNSWIAEVEKRLAQSENLNKKVTLEFQRTRNNAKFIIRDQGEGFDWQEYMEVSPERAFDNHGRGIAMAKMISFDSIEYQGNGNTVIATINL
ncbi:MAG: response regulator [Gammaproteobacteria bacterium]|nr:response regulator [Gammaproteobacteria bacterium]